MTRDIYLAELSAAHREALEARLVAFEQAWTEQALATWVRQLPPPSDPLRGPTLLELVRIDLERRWRTGRGLPLESYLDSFPELGTPETVAVELVLAEYEARLPLEPALDPDEFARRFPRQAKAFRQRVEQASRQTPAGVAAPQRDTDGSRAKSAPGTRRASSSVALPPRFGRYQIIRPLGKGGMGSVYLAHDTQLQRPVALKVPHFTPGASPEVLHRFTREARAAATLSHPNLCPVHDVGEIDGIPFLTMTYIEGQPMADSLVEGQPMGIRQAAGLVRKLALALQEAHARGIVHRDLKPANIMINLRGEPVIMDFGLARQVNLQEARLTRNGSVVGTPAYMAPEQLRGEDQAAGVSCDIYSLGVIFYELLTGRLPFEGSAMAVIGQILTQVPPPPSQQRPDLNPRLEAICLKAMARDPRDRYASMADLAADLTAYLRTPSRKPVSPGSEERATQRSAAPAPEARRPKLRARTGIAAAALGGAVLLGVIVFLLTNSGEVRIELSDPTAPVEVRVDGNTIAVQGLGEPLRFRVGDHALVVEGKNYETISQSFTIRRGQTDTLRVSLKPAPRVSTRATRPAAAPQAARLPETLFNGKDHTGWTVELGDPERWRVEDGALTVTGTGWPDRSYYLTEKQYTNYILRAQFQLDERSIGGIVLRALAGENQAAGDPSHAIFGFANFGPVAAGLFWAREGSTYLMPDQPLALRPPGVWNEVEVRLHGVGLWVMVNGQQVLQLNLTQLPDRGITYPGLKRPQGQIGLFRHTGTIRYRNIELQELPLAPDPADLPPADKVVVPVLQGRRALVYGEEWRIGGQELLQTELAPFRRIFFGDASWTDYDFEFEARQTGGTEGFSAIFRAADVWNYYQFSYGIFQNHSYVTETIEEATPRTLRSIRDAKLVNDQWYRARISVRGLTYQCYLDDRLIHEFTGPAHSHGGVGFRTWNTSVRFRNIKVTSPDGKVLFEGLPELPGRPRS